MAEDPQISIIIPSYNDQALVRDRLLELAGLETGVSYELILVDDGSDDPFALPSKPALPVQLIRNDVNRGAAVARNQGAAKAQGRYLLFFSSFLRIPKDLLTRLDQLIEANNFDLAQIPVIADPNIELTHFQAFLANQRGRVDTPEKLPVKQTLFTALFMKAETFQSQAGFDENMHHYGGHELDLVYRLDQSGFDRRIMFKDLSLERVALSDQEKIKTRLREYGKKGLPNLLSKHPELKNEILQKPVLWRISRWVGIPHIWERILEARVEKNILLSPFLYRLYLHLIMRNAWDAR